MLGTLNPRVKICCISSYEEAKLAIDYGASALGLVGPMPSGPGIIDNKLIREIVINLPPGISSFLLTSEVTSSGIIDHYKKVATTTIQMVDDVSIDDYSRIRDLLPGIKLVQVIHVVDERSVEESILKSEYVDAILLDSGNPNLNIKQLGGTGRVHNWDLSALIREEIDIPLFLAGGLNPSNIVDAIRKVQPYGVDICSGVRVNGKLSREKLRAFFSAIDQLNSSSA